MKKAAISVLLCVLLLLSACAGADSDSSTEESAQSQSQSQEPSSQSSSQSASSPPAEPSQPEEPSKEPDEASAREEPPAAQSESEASPEASGSGVEDPAPLFAVEGEDYSYDEATGWLSFPKLGFRCAVEPAAMEYVKLSIHASDMPNEAGTETITVHYIEFHFAQLGENSLMFMLYHWPAEDWDVPRSYGPLPVEAARSADGQWVILHGPSQLVGESGSRELWNFTDMHEKEIVQSVAFTD